MWGNKIKINVFGESHGDAIGVVLEGLPSGFQIDFEKLKLDMKRRVAKLDGISTARVEADDFTVISGIYNGKTTGTPFCAIIKNQNVHSSDYDNIKYTPRPGHADYTSYVKSNGYADIRGGGHSSGRLTAPLVLAGGICRQILELRGIKICSHIYNIGGIQDDSLDACTANVELIEDLKKSNFPVVNIEAGEKMKEHIYSAKSQGDSVGGIVECGIYGSPKGLGEPMFEGIESVISSMIFSIPGVKGIEFGAGFNVANLYGSENNDEFYYDTFDNCKIKTKTNNSGGILGGVTNGMPIIFRTAIKPTPSISKAQNTIDLNTKQNCKIVVNGRHDACIVPRACAVIEGAVSIALLDIILR